MRSHHSNKELACFFCEKTVGKDAMCFGCRKPVCDGCNQNYLLTGKHDVSSHQVDYKDDD